MTPRTCTKCQTTTAKRWQGIRTGVIVCQKCYAKALELKRRAQMRPKLYQFAGEV